MSASVYNNPYTYKEPLPRINYPSFCSGCKISLKYVMDSKFLALAAMLFLVAMFFTLFCIISPFWFKLVFSADEGTFGVEAVKRELSINTGIFFMNENKFDNLVELNKMSNQDVVPKLLVFAQVLEVAGACCLMACLAGSVMLMLRRFASATSNFILAFFSSLAGVFLVGVFVFSLIMSMSSSCDPYDTGNDCVYENNLKWRVIPIYTQFFRVEPVVTPLVKLNWTFYISIIAAALTLAGSGLVWLEAFKTYGRMKEIRYTQLRTARNVNEGDIHPLEHNKQLYRGPVMPGTSLYGKKRDMLKGGLYAVEGPQQPQQDHNVGFAQYGEQPQQHGVGFAQYGEQPRQHSVGFDQYESDGPSPSAPPSRRRSPPPPRRRSPSPSPSPPSRRRSPPPSYSRQSPSPPSHRRRSPSPPSHRRRSPSPPSHRRRSPSPPSRYRRSPSPPRRGPPSMNSSMSEGPYVSREIDL